MNFGGTGTSTFGSTPAKSTGFATTFGTSTSTPSTGFGFGSFGQQQQPQQQTAPTFGSTFGNPPSSAPPAFGATFGATASTAPTFGSTFGTMVSSAAPTFGTYSGAVQPQQGTGVFGSTTSKPILFGAPAPTTQNLFSTQATGTSNLFGGTGTTQTPNLFGGTTTSGTSLFGTGTGTTTTPSLFGTGFGQTAATTAPSLFGTGTGGTGTFGGGGLFGTSASTAPSLFGSSGFGTSTSTATSSFGGFGTGATGFGGFGTGAMQPGLFSSGLGAKPFTGVTGQQAPPQTAQSKNQQVIDSVYAINVFNDERDDILKKWNMLQACWGVGKGFYNSSQPPVEYTPQNPFYRFKAMGYNIIPEHDNSEGIVRLIFNKKITELRNQETVLKNGIGGVLGNRPNLTIDILLIKAVSDTQTEVKICVSEKGVTGSSRKIPATDLATFLNQPVQRQQLTNVGVCSISPYVTPSKAELEEYLKHPPSGIDPQMWQAAIQDNPNPKKYIPVPINGFSDLRSRMLNQEYQTGLHQAFLDKVGKEISELKTKHSSSIAQINELKQKLMELQHRILRVLVKQECTRKVGIAIQPEEELLRGRLEVMHTQLNLPQQYKGQIKELLSYVKMIKSSQKQNGQNYRINGDALEETKQFLKMEQSGIAQLINIINNDVKALKIITDGLKAVTNSHRS